MTRLLVCAPLAIEAWAVRSGLSAASPAEPLEPPDAVVVRTGLGGGSRRSRVVPSLVQEHDAVVVAGFGGALDEVLRPGDVLVATEVRYEGRRLPTDEPDLLARELTLAGVRARTGPLVTTGHVVWGAERRRLSRDGARAVDMEAGPLLSVAAGRPVAVVRAIVDTPGRPLSSPRVVGGGLAAMRTLRRIGPALIAWSTAVAPGDVPPESPPEDRRIS